MKKILLIIAFLSITLYLVCFKKPTQIVPYEPAMEEAFIKYQKTDMFSTDKYDKIYQFNEAHKVFEVRKKLGRYYVYMYYFFEIKYNPYTNSGGTNPLIVILKKHSDNTYKVIKLKEPSSGDTYVNSIKRLFPDYIADNMLENKHAITTELQKNLKRIR